MTTQTRRFPSVSGKFFLCRKDVPETHYALRDGTWTKVKSWTDSEGHRTIDELADLLVLPEYADWHIVWVMDGKHWCLDLDSKNAHKVAEALCAPADVEHYANMLIEQHTTTADTASEYTFVEKSRSGNGWHIIFNAFDERLGTKDPFGCAELYQGDHKRFIILTGWAHGDYDVDDLPFGAFLRERFPLVAKIPDELPLPLTPKDSADLREDDNWFFTGIGEPPLDDKNQIVTDASVLRFKFLCSLAKQAYGMADARERIWESISNSWFASDYTVHNSSNPDRFTRMSKALGVKYKEINKALSWAHEDAQQLALNRERNLALVGPLVRASIEKIDEAMKSDEEARRVAAPPPRSKKTPEIPPIPDSPLFNLVAEVVRNNMSKPHEGWEAITTLFVSGMIAGSCFRGACPAIVVPGETGAGKANVKKFVNGITDDKTGDANLPFYDVRSDFTSGESIRDNVSDRTHLVGLLDEAGPLLSNIGAGDPRFASWQTYLTTAIDGAKINKTARAKSSREQENIAVDAPRLSIYMALQPRYMAAYLGSYSIENGICGRLTTFPPQHRQRDAAPAYVRDRIVGAELLKQAMKLAASAGRQLAYHWVTFDDEEAIAKRLHSEFPMYRVLEPIHARLGEMVKRWATISFASRMFSVSTSPTGQSTVMLPAAEHRWIPLEPQDVDFGFAMAQMHWQALKYYIETGDAAIGGEGVKQRLIYEGILACIKENTKKGQRTISLGVLKQKTKGFRGKGRVNGVGMVELDESDMRALVDELIAAGALTTGNKGNNGRGVVWGFNPEAEEMIETRIRECHG